MIPFARSRERTFALCSQLFRLLRSQQISVCSALFRKSFALFVRSFLLNLTLIKKLQFFLFPIEKSLFYEERKQLFFGLRKMVKKVCFFSLERGRNSLHSNHLRVVLPFVSYVLSLHCVLRLRYYQQSCRSRIRQNHFSSHTSTSRMRHPNKLNDCLTILLQIG